MSNELVTFDEIKAQNQRLKIVLEAKIDKDSISSETFVTKTEAADYTQQILTAIDAIPTDPVSTDNLVTKTEAADYTQQMLTAIDAIPTDPVSTDNLVTKTEAAQNTKRILSAIMAMGGGGSSGSGDSLFLRDVVVIDSESETTITDVGLNIDARQTHAAIAFDGNATANVVLLGVGDNYVSFGNFASKNTVIGGGGNDTYFVNDTSKGNCIDNFDSASDLIVYENGDISNIFVAENTNSALIKHSPESVNYIMLKDFNSDTVTVQINSSETSTHSIVGNSSNGKLFANSFDNANLSGTSLNECFINLGNNVSIDTGDGDDMVITYGDNNSIVTGDGNDTVINYGTGSTLYGNIESVALTCPDIMTYINSETSEAKNITAYNGKIYTANKQDSITLNLGTGSRFLNRGTAVTVNLSSASNIEILNQQGYVTVYPTNSTFTCQNDNTARASYLRFAGTNNVTISGDGNWSCQNASTENTGNANIVCYSNNSSFWFERLGKNKVTLAGGSSNCTIGAVGANISNTTVNSNGNGHCLNLSNSESPNMTYYVYDFNKDKDYLYIGGSYNTVFSTNSVNANYAYISLLTTGSSKIHIYFYGLTTGDVIKINRKGTPEGFKIGTGRVASPW